MRKQTTIRSLITAAATLCVGTALAASPVSVTIGSAAKGCDVPSSLWGIFYEDINCAGTTADGETIVKLVNALEEPRDVTINLKGKASVIVLAGQKLDDNRRETPDVSKPQTRECTLDGTYTVPACSLTVLRVK